MSLVIPQTPGRSRMEEAARLIQQALLELHREGRERAERAKNFKVKYSEREKLVIAKAKARMATKEARIEVNRRWFWSTMNGVLEDWREQADAAQKRGERLRADQLEDAITRLADELQKISTKEAAR
jgi:hypothetical protein